jgi:cytidylate kinase
MHYGIKGMRWGIRKDRTHSDVQVKTGRLDLFGSPGHNILYVTGISGSGKSTLALNLAKKLDAEPIHLDWYYDGRSNQESSFKKFLRDNGVDLKKVYDKNHKLNYSESDKIFPLLQEYSKQHRIIVEGVQLLDQTMSVDMRKVLMTEPVISVQTSTRVAFNRAEERDGKTSVNTFVKLQQTKRLQDAFDNDLALKIGEAYTQTLLE